MAFVLVVARVVLAAVFAVAGVAKLRDLGGSREALRRFSVPAVLAGPLGLALPLVELAVAGGLLVSGVARVAAVAAVGLLAAFSVAIAAALVRGQTPECNCFGQFSAAPVSSKTLGRNVGLLLIATLVVVGGVGASPTHWVTQLDAFERVTLAATVLLGIGLVAVGWFAFQLFAQNGRLLARVQTVEAALGVAASGAVPGGADPTTVSATPGGLAVGVPAPGFQVPGLDGPGISLESLCERGRRVMLIFSDRQCGACQELLPTIERWQVDHDELLTIALIGTGSPEDAWARLDPRIRRVGIDSSGEVARSYQVAGTPTAVLVSPIGEIESAQARGSEAIKALLADAIGLLADEIEEPARHEATAAFAASGRGRAAAVGVESGAAVGGASLVASDALAAADTQVQKLRAVLRAGDMSMSADAGRLRDAFLGLADTPTLAASSALINAVRRQRRDALKLRTSVLALHSTQSRARRAESLVEQGLSGLASALDDFDHALHSHNDRDVANYVKSARHRLASANVDRRKANVILGCNPTC